MVFGGKGRVVIFAPSTFCPFGKGSGAVASFTCRKILEQVSFGVLVVTKGSPSGGTSRLPFRSDGKRLFVFFPWSLDLRKGRPFLLLLEH